MPKLQNAKYAFAIFLILGACSSVPQSQQATPTSSEQSNRQPASHSWGSYHWARTTPQFTLQLGDNLTTSEWRSHLAQASSDWNSPETFGATYTPILTAVVLGKSIQKKCTMVKGTGQVCNRKYGNNGWLGIASINIVGNHITQGTAKMNDSYFSYAKYNNANERQHVMCQEIAHIFGLGHTSEDGSSQNTCMDYFSNTGVNATNTNSTRPNQHDFELLQSIYSHLDSTSTVAPYSSSTSVSEATEDPKTWGKHLNEMRRGRHSYYEKMNKDGSLTITHVYWTEEAAAKCKDCDLRDHH